MSIPFFDRDNPWIDKLVQLARDRQKNHTGQYIFVPPHNEEREFVNDTPSEDELEPKLIDFSGWGENEEENFAPPQEPTASTAVVAVDTGVVNLGELSSGGTVFAIRGAAVCYPPNDEKPFIFRYNTGALVIDRKNMFPLFHYMGRRLGQEELFVKVLSTPPYYQSKSSMAETSNQIQDRCRNFVERMIQEEAIAILESYEGGILLLDGALSGGTYDTPEMYLRNMLSSCRSRKIKMVAISKKTRITVGGRAISHLFDDQPEFIGYAPLSKTIDKERQAVAGGQQSLRSVQELSVAEEIYAVRFSYAPPGLTFRADVHSTLGCLAPEVLNQVYSRCQIYGGYPRPLIEAHQYSSFLYQELQLLLVDVIVGDGLRPQEEPSMDVLFQPFGGGYK
jgi:hypothetical protein